MIYVVHHPRLGYLKLFLEPGQYPMIGDEYSVVVDKGDCSAFGRDNAVRLAEALNKKEGHKLWKAVLWTNAG